MTSDLATRTTRGLVWILAENFGIQAIQLVVSIVLARLLLPEELGLIGMLALFRALALSLLDSGFGWALIQKKDATHLDSCSVFYFNLLVGLLLTILLWAAAPLIARFFDEPLLIPLTCFLALNLIINAFGLVPSALLTKRMDFKALLQVSLVAVGISGAVSIVLAMQGFGVWSLAVQSVLGSLIRVLLIWLLSPWRPSWIFSRASLTAMFPFGSRLLLASLLDASFRDIYQPLIGKLYSATDLGYYMRAETLQASAVQPSGSALGRVLFPALSPIQDDRVRLNHAVRKAMNAAAFLHFPLMIGLIAAADALIVVLLTDRWATSIPYFRLFCVAGLVYPLSAINLTVLTATGRSDLFFRLEVAKKLLVLLAIALTYRWGITALLYGQIMTAFAAYALNSHYAASLINYPTSRQMRDIAPFLLMSLVMGGAMVCIGGVISSPLPRLLAQSLAGMAVYLALNVVLSRPMLAEMIQLARKVVRVPAIS